MTLQFMVVQGMCPFSISHLDMIGLLGQALLKQVPRTLLNTTNLLFCTVTNPRQSPAIPTVDQDQLHDVTCAVPCVGPGLTQSAALSCSSSSQPARQTWRASFR